MSSLSLFFKKVTDSVFKTFTKPARKQVTSWDKDDPTMAELIREPKTRNIVAGEYGVSVKTLNRWIREKELKIPRGLICPSDLRSIYATLGPPDHLKYKHRP